MNLKQRIQTAGSRLETVLGSVINDKSWKASLTDESSLEDVIAKGRETYAQGCRRRRT